MAQMEWSIGIGQGGCHQDATRGLKCHKTQKFQDKCLGKPGREV
jgi:hypothetical protein